MNKGIEKPVAIPIDIVMLVAEALSDYNDGWTQKGAKDKLIAIRDYIDNAVGGDKKQ